MTSSQTAPIAPFPTEPRSAPEATALLVELGRALRGCAFYERGNPALQSVLSRALRLWLADLERHGALALEVSPSGIRIPAISHQVPKLHLGGLSERLGARGVQSLRFEPGLDADALAAFVELLAGEPGPPEADGGFAGALYTHVPDGLVVNGVDPATWAPPGAEATDESELEEIEPGPEIPPETFDAKDRDVSGFDFASGELRGDHERSRAVLPSVDAVPPRPAPAPDVSDADAAPGLDYSLSDAELELETDEDVTLEPASEPAPVSPEPETLELNVAADPVPEEETAPAAQPDAPTDVDTDVILDTAHTVPTPAGEPPDGAHEDTDTDVLREIPREDTDATPALDPEGDGRWNQLRGLLSELDRCTEDFKYNDIARRAEMLAASLTDEGRSEAGIRALRLFVQHAGDAAKRTPRQREVAGEQLERLATGSRLEDLIELSCGDDAAAALDASQLLLAAGKPVIAPLLRMTLRERKPERRAKLTSTLIALGDLIGPELVRALDAEDVGELRAAARLAGESQNPKTVDRLEDLLMHPEPSLRQEVAKALARIGDARSTEALARALTSPLEGVPTSAAYCLGASGSGRAVEALLTALLGALENGDFGFAGEVIRSLGRLGRPEATPDLAAVLLHRGMRKRRQYRELKLAAAAALGRIPGDAAAGALAQAAQARDAQVRRSAQTALDRRNSKLGD